MKPGTFLQFLAIPVLAALTNLTSVNVSFAQSVQDVEVDTARDGYTITVSPGHGLTLDFSEVGERIYRAWLDDPSRVVVDFDIPLCTSAGDECPGAAIAHLRQINRLEIDELPSTETTLLTLVTRSADGDVNLYPLRVTFSSAPGVAAISFIERRAPQSSLMDQIATVAEMRGGLSYILEHGISTPNGPEVEAIRTLIRQLENGTPMADAMTDTGVPEAVVEQLALYSRIEIEEESEPTEESETVEQPEVLGELETTKEAEDDE